MEIIKKDGDFSIVKNGERYEVYKGSEVLKTPGRNVAYTIYLPIAERLLKDWKEQGYQSYTSSSSILSYHFTMVDHFSRLGKKGILKMLEQLHWFENWTFQPCPSPDPEVMMTWKLYFGDYIDRIILVQKWFENQTPMQLAASTCIYNSLESYNVALFMATVVERIPEKRQKGILKRYYTFFRKFDDFFSLEDFLDIFDCFKLYYGIHFETDGKHVPEITEDDEEEE